MKEMVVIEIFYSNLGVRGLCVFSIFKEFHFIYNSTTGQQPVIIFYQFLRNPNVQRSIFTCLIYLESRESRTQYRTFSILFAVLLRSF